MKILQKLYEIFDKRTKIKFFILLCAIVFGSLLEMLALALISPFISLLLEPDAIFENVYILWVYEFLGLADISQLLVVLAFLLAFVYIFRGVYIYFLNHVKFRFIARRQSFLSQRLLTKLLGLSYVSHTQRNIAESQRMIIHDVAQLFGMITSILFLFADFFMMFFILIFLIIVSPLMTLIVTILASMCAIIYMKIFRKQIRAAGQKNRESNIGMLKAVNQALGGIKEVKLMRREKYFFNIFKESSNIFIHAFAQYRTLSVIPKLAIETICFGGAFILLGIFILGGLDVSGIVPQLSLFVVAAFRLLPSISRQITYINTVLFSRVSVDAVYKSLFEVEDEYSELIMDSSIDNDNCIVVQGLSFCYPNTHEPVLEDVFFDIQQKKSVAFIGSSGAGKTTLIDLILGVITPTGGRVYYDGKSIHHNFEEWSMLIGYIPQQIYLLDETIRENVAFGIEQSNINEDKIWRALEQAQLTEFVKSLPQGLDTVIGDRGIRLSGGQRQRIGIARAMYEDPPILVLDEATSSLDNETERAVMDAVMGFKGNKTMLIVAHRLSTIEHCDIVFRVENKKVVIEREN